MLKRSIATDNIASSLSIVAEKSSSSQAVVRPDRGEAEGSGGEGERRRGGEGGEECYERPGGDTNSLTR